MLKRVQITNMGAFATFDSGPLPAVCLLEGDNGVGKTSLQDCIKWVGENGHDPDMVHGGAEFGEVIITTDDDTQLRVRTTRDDTLRFWKPKDGKRWIKGREEIDKIYHAIAFSPLDFLKLKEDRQAEEFAKLSSDKADPEELAAAVGDAKPETASAKILPSMSGLDHINALIKAINETRTTLNVGADTQEKHALELERTLPPPAPQGTDWGAEADRLQREKEILEGQERDDIEAIATEFHAAKENAGTACQSEFQAIDAEIDAKIAALNEERQARKGKAAGKRDDSIEAARDKANLRVANLRAANAPTLEKLTADLATAKERARAQQEAEGTRKAIAAAREGAEQKRTRRAVLTAAVERLDALKTQLAARVMEKTGARLEGGRIVREQAGGLVPLKKWNTADQWKFCLRFGMMLGGGFVLVDGINVFTDANQKALFETAKRYAHERGVQFIFSKVRPEGGAMRVGEPELVTQQ